MVIWVFPGIKTEFLRYMLPLGPVTSPGGNSHNCVIVSFGRSKGTGGSGHGEMAPFWQDSRSQIRETLPWYAWICSIFSFMGEGVRSSQLCDPLKPESSPTCHVWGVPLPWGCPLLLFSVAKEHSFLLPAWRSVCCGNIAGGGWASTFGYTPRIPVDSSAPQPRPMAPGTAEAWPRQTAWGGGGGGEEGTGCQQCCSCQTGKVTSGPLTLLNKGVARHREQGPARSCLTRQRRAGKTQNTSFGLLRVLPLMVVTGSPLREPLQVTGTTTHAQPGRAALEKKTPWKHLESSRSF